MFFSTETERRRQAAANLVLLLGLLVAIGVALESVPALVAADRNLRFAAPGGQLASDPAATPAVVVDLPDGSVNALQDAIAAAGPGGVVIVEAGSHVEESVVLIEIPVSIIGEPGAVIESTTTPAGLDPPFLIEGALHVRNTSNVVISGLESIPLGGGPSNTAIVIENSPRVTVSSNFINGYTAGVLVQEGDRVDISDNTITLTGADHGIVIVNGRFARITDNVISNTVFGIWACDENGHAMGNSTENSFIGLILCNVPPAAKIGEDGEVFGSELPATKWHVQNNYSSGNTWGYAITDGSNRNLMANNAASNNIIDIEVLGDSEFFGFFTPTAFDNVIAVGSNAGITVHDCGVDTNVAGNADLLELDCFE